MFPAETGLVIMFTLATTVQVIVAAYLAGYAAHCFLVVLEDTAAGINQIEWPDQPVLDWLWKVLYLAWLIAFWLVPTVLLLSVAAPALVSHFPGLPPIYAAVGVIWLLFPISLFSSLSASSLWVVFRFEVLRRLAHHLPATLVVYLARGVLLGGWAWLFHAALFRQLLLLPLAALSGAALLLIDARLLGRLSWLLNYRTPERRKRPRKKKKRPRTPAVEASDPWEIPPAEEAMEKKQSPRHLREVPQTREEDEEPFDPHTDEGYGLAEDEPRLAPLPRQPSPPEETDEPIGLQPFPDDPPREGADSKKGPLSHLTEVSEFEASLAAPAREPEPPASPLWSGVYQFPWYAGSVGAWLGLSFGALAAGGLLKLQLVVWPFG